MQIPSRSKIIDFYGEACASAVRDGVMVALPVNDGHNYKYPWIVPSLITRMYCGIV